MPTCKRVPLADAAKRLGISWHRAWRLVLTGDLDASKNDGRWFVTVASIDRFLGSKSSNSSSPKG